MHLELAENSHHLWQFVVNVECTWTIKTLNFVPVFSNIPELHNSGKQFAERVEARGYTSNVAVNYVKETLQLERKDVSCSINNPPIGLNHPYNSNNRLAISTVGYEGGGAVRKQLSVEAARDLQRLGHLGFGKNYY